MTSFRERFRATLVLSFVPLIFGGYSIYEASGSDSIYYLFIAWFSAFVLITFFTYFHYSVVGAILWGLSLWASVYYYGNTLSINVILLLSGAIYLPTTLGYAYYSLRRHNYRDQEAYYRRQEANQSKENYEDYSRGMGWSPEGERKEPEVKVITKVVEKVREVPRQLTNGELGRVINYWQQKFNEAPEGSRARAEANRKIREYQEEYKTGKTSKEMVK